MEEWKPVKGYEGVYEISNRGRVVRIETEKLLQPAVAKNGYYIVSLWSNNKGKTHYIHRLIAEAFIHNPNPKKFRTVNHIDGNKLNNEIPNLEWCTYSRNNQHAYDTGLKTVSENVVRAVRKRALKRNKGNNYRSITVVAYDLEGNHIGDFISAKEASEVLDVNRTTVHKILKNKVSNPKKYVFKYKEEY